MFLWLLFFSFRAFDSLGLDFLSYFPPNLLSAYGTTFLQYVNVFRCPRKQLDCDKEQEYWCEWKVCPSQLLILELVIMWDRGYVVEILDSTLESALLSSTKVSLISKRLWYLNLLDLPQKKKEKERDYGTWGEGCSSRLSGHICAIWSHHPWRPLPCGFW